MPRNIMMIGLVLSLLFFSCRPRVVSGLSESIGESAANEFVDSITKDINLFGNAKSEEEKDIISQRVWTRIVEVYQRNPAMLRANLQKLILKSVSESSSQAVKDLVTRETLDLVFDTIEVQIQNQNRFISWNSIKNAMLERPLPDRLQSINDLKTNLQNLIGAAGSFLPYDGEFSVLASSSGPYKKLDLLIHGKESWEYRHELMSSAKKNLWISSWAFYDDLETGKKAVQKLAQLKSKGVDVRVVVDGIVSKRVGHDAITTSIVNLGIPVIRWQHPKFLGFGMHRKIMIIDSGTDREKLILGGKNFGNNYSHLKPPIDSNATDTEIRADLRGRWRDTDIVVSGTQASVAAAQFAKAWNQYVSIINPASGLSLIPDSNSALKSVPINNNSKNYVAILDHDPSENINSGKFVDPIYETTIHLIRSATASIKISNAYFILTEPLFAALVEAMNRGVHVEIHTNSQHSMDEADRPLLGPIYRSLRAVLNVPEAQKQASFKQPSVYLQKGRTLHSKYLVIDDRAGWVSSYNIHPRSARYESEVAAVFLGQETGNDLSKMFSLDVAPDLAPIVEDIQTVTLPPSQLFDVIEKIIFEQL
ncbi:MAG: phosphatidylserine/phosphatidylglycerophosphate/cardiolipin synthase family protein [Proteobacteria bacterium]|nr:phosphatidylserine/phosphatidylglycerophosphate/cardiolipin synthase family protein [Pseudomonadota bacterium]